MAKSEEQKLVDFFRSPEGERLGIQGDHDSLSPAETAIRAMRSLPASEGPLPAGTMTQEHVDALMRCAESPWPNPRTALLVEEASNFIRQAAAQHPVSPNEPPERWSLREVDGGDEDEPTYDGMRTDPQGGWVRFEDVAALVSQRPVSVSEPPHDYKRTVESLSAMLGWVNVPPQHMLEGEIRALKARVAASRPPEGQT